MKLHGESLSILPNIYDCAVNPDIWGNTLEIGAQKLGAKGAILLVIDQHADAGLQLNHYSKIWSRAPERVKMYNREYAHYEKPVWDKLNSTPKQNLILDTTFWADESNLLERPDYKYLRENVGIVHKCAARLNDNMSWWDTLVVHFDKKLNSIPESAVEGINQILPHVAKSIELARAFDALKQQYNAVLSALDQVEIGLCIALENGDLVVRNAEANRILAEKDGIRFSNDGKIFVHNTKMNAQLQNAIQQVSQTACGENATHELLFLFQRDSGSAELLIEVAPLRDYQEELERNLSGALITLIDPSNPQSFNSARAVSAYKLTPAEGLICQLLVDGNSTATMAEKRNVSPETIRSQVKSVLQKMNCSRRSDLIRLVLKTTPPIKAATHQKT